MTRFSLSGWTAILAATAAAGAPAYADRALQLTYRENPGYARITAKWADGSDTAPKIAASVVNQVLVLTFDEKVTLNLDELKKSLPNWAAVTRMDPDGMTARIGLKQLARTHSSVSVDLAAIDLVPAAQKADPPDIVSPLLARRAAEAEAKRVAALPPPPPQLELEVRGSHAGDSSRVAFYWPERVSYKVVGQGEGMLKLQFSKRAKADLAYLHITPPPNLDKFTGENTPQGYLVTITSKDKLPIKHFMDGDIPVLDISKPLPPEDAEQPAAKPAPKPEPVAAKAPPAGKPGLLTPPKAAIDDEARMAAEEAARAEAALAVAPVGGPEHVTAMARSWSDPAPRSGVVDVKVAPLASGVELQATFAAPAPAAVFARGSAVWAVFAANADLKIDPTALPAGFRVRTQRGPNATMMRIEAPRGLTVSAELEDTSWRVRIAPTAVKPQRFVKPDRRPGGGGRARIETMMIGAAGIVWFEDPAIGDKLAVAVAYGPASASPAAKDFVEASLPATAHGLAIVPKADDVVVTLEGERVVVSLAAGAQSMPEPQAVAAEVAPDGHAAFIDFAGWAGKAGEDFYVHRNRLEREATRYDPATPEGADKLLDLARFYLSQELALEALGVMRMASGQRPEVELDPRFLGMRGAANLMAGRLAAAEADLSKGSLREDGSAALWRALIATQRGEWERAGDFFRQGGKQINEYPPRIGARFAAAWAEAALGANDYETARRQASQAVGSGERAEVERGKLVLANLSAIIEGASAAYPEFERLSKEASEPIAVRAELKRLELAVPAGKLTANEAAGELESLRFRWRGDDVEMATVGILADQYMRAGRFRDALVLAQGTALRDANAPGARDLRIKLSDYFKRLYLNGEADRLDPIQSLGLFYEFKDLTPIGVDGDQMIRKLAQRLVAFDLLGPAAELLQYQVDNRIRGVGKAAIAVDLARIYLMDKRPDKALAAINTTRQPSLPKELAFERRLLEAAGYLELGRYDHVVELVEPLEGDEAKSLLAEAYWRGRNWTDAAKAYTAMLPPPSQAKANEAPVAFKAAIAARMAKDPALIAQVRAYAPVLANDANKASFDLITSQTEGSSAAISEAVRRMADAPRVDAFATAMKQRFAAPVAPAAAPAAPKPAAPAAPQPAAAGQTAATAPVSSGGQR